MAQAISRPAGSERAAADFFAVLSSPIRLAVLRLLVDSERCVTELVEALGIAQPRLSNHLACLRTCGFVTVRRKGTFLYYALADDRVAEILKIAENLSEPTEAALAGCAVLEQELEGNKE